MLETSNLSEGSSIVSRINEISAKELNAENEVLVEDKFIYKKCHLSEVGIEFGSDKFYSWKEENKNLYFPSLDAPWEVRRAWREFNERISKDSKNAVFDSLEEHMHFNVTKTNGFFKGVRLKSITDYKHLFNLAINTYREFYDRTSNIIYKQYINLLVD
ncbi:hypothetical protein SAMN04487886_103310 [Clostridium sp. DSM 8431]|uniref:hypothetical protein n=1 Tax=Clostridium sp. DSM 8431 TaxID=1761781 RepID=UPI0008DFC3B5|nr:hypothetical protein [Clostridium sp. DSM 8431]SFU46016.1 hypothetical protein SAMN04487886_103310 [Clostridium sp. DSM 8431]